MAGNDINPVEFGKMLATLENIHDDILGLRGDVKDVQADVKTQNSRVYKLEEKTERISEKLETHSHDAVTSMSVKDRMVQHGIPGAAGGVTAMAVIYGLVELAKLLAGKL